MHLDRRQFLEVLGTTAFTAVGATPAGASGGDSHEDPMGMLVDTTNCIGCRKCEFACSQAHHLNDLPVEAFEDKAVFENHRRMDANALTVVNRFPNEEEPDKPTYVKSNCLHCLNPGCVSACLVGALQKTETGAVVYDPWKCIGCRYCMVACPFEVPAYEFLEPLAPRVRKCDFCAERTAEGKIPACAEMCPPMCLTYGKRSELLQMAREKIEERPDRYVHRIYGEEEAGGTAWLYLAPKEFEQLGFIHLGSEGVPVLTETIQHSIFRYGVLPLMLFGLLGATMRSLGPEVEPEPAISPIGQADEQTLSP
ncbi:MAG: 4Fe-4S dicluster domain-containing protein [Candidatus Omnitrophica bacterium]|nr:Formate dehydrogenase-O iron-sulfur subunit [bacterium]NUN98724.1 4Fe-4S dicluster domain-containing protein [Candidatus Omnitrophota bacterium]